MIEQEGVRSAATAATLDDLFRRAGVRHPHTLALADPLNRDAFAENVPRQLNFAQADRAISSCAARLRGLGLQTDSIVAMHLPNTVESIITFLGVLRAGMVAVPLPLLWRKAEIRSALSRVGAKAIVTYSRIGTDAQAEIAMQSAADLFSVRHVVASGTGCPTVLYRSTIFFLPTGSWRSRRALVGIPASRQSPSIWMSPDSSLYRAATSSWSPAALRSFGRPGLQPMRQCCRPSRSHRSPVSRSQ
jgi:hypothetical protein